MPVGAAVAMRVADNGLSMMTMRDGFARYCLVGVVNTAFHAVIFLSLHLLFGVSQASSNLAGFLAAVSLSFLLKARFTFESHRSWRRYWLYVGCMVGLSLGIGALGDGFAWIPLVTLLVFSCVSLVVGYLFSRHVVFTGWLS